MKFQTCTGVYTDVPLVFVDPFQLSNKIMIGLHNFHFIISMDVVFETKIYQLVIFLHIPDSLKLNQIFCYSQKFLVLL